MKKSTCFKNPVIVIVKYINKELARFKIIKFKLDNDLFYMKGENGHKYFIELNKILWWEIIANEYEEVSDKNTSSSDTNSTAMSNNCKANNNILEIEIYKICENFLNNIIENKKNPKEKTDLYEIEIQMLNDYLLIYKIYIGDVLYYNYILNFKKEIIKLPNNNTLSLSNNNILSLAPVVVDALKIADIYKALGLTEITFKREWCDLIDYFNERNNIKRTTRKFLEVIQYRIENLK